GGADLPGGDGTLGVVLAEDGQGHLAKPGEVLGGVAVIRATAVLSEDDVEDPMLAVLDAPVVPGSLGVELGFVGTAADEVGRLDAFLAVLAADAHHADDGLE